MKRVLIFIGLKIAEIVGVAVALAVCYLAGYLVLKVEAPVRITDHIAMIAIGILLTGVSYPLIFHIIPAWIKSNWEKAGEIARRGK